MVRVALLTVGLLVVGEQFPFSYFPMYSSFDPMADYYYVARVDGTPLACVPTFGTSTANVKKMYRARLRALTAGRGATEFEATPAERSRVGEEMIEYLRELGRNAGIAVPVEPIRLLRVVITRSPTNEIVRAEEPIAEK